MIIKIDLKSMKSSSITSIQNQKLKQFLNFFENKNAKCLSIGHFVYDQNNGKLI